jgi:hypothetical protein
LTDGVRFEPATGKTLWATADLERSLSAGTPLLIITPPQDKPASMANMKPVYTGIALDAYLVESSSPVMPSHGVMASPPK